MVDIQELIANLNLIDEVIPNYTAGRKEGFSDDECDIIANKAVGMAIEVLHKQIPKTPLEDIVTDED